MNQIFRTGDFALEVVCKGSFLDSDPSYGGDVFLIDTIVVRLNHVALNAWLGASIVNEPECYETHQEWIEHSEKKARMLREVRYKIAALLDIDRSAGSLSITQGVSEIFTVVHIRKVISTAREGIHNAEESVTK